MMNFLVWIRLCEIGVRDGRDLVLVGRHKYEFERKLEEESKDAICGDEVAIAHQSLLLYLQWPNFLQRQLRTTTPIP